MFFPKDGQTLVGGFLVKRRFIIPAMAGIAL
jgi:hypothetical protein